MPRALQKLTNKVDAPSSLSVLRGAVPLNQPKELSGVRGDDNPTASSRSWGPRGCNCNN